MVTFFETRSYWQGGSTEDEKNIIRIPLISKGLHLWKLINQLEMYARNLCSIFDISFCCDESECHMNFKHFPFQCACNVNETLASYVKGYYNCYDVERIEEFVAFKGAYEIASFLQNIDDAPYESENLPILKYCYDNYKDDNSYITEYLKGLFPSERRD